MNELKNEKGYVLIIVLFVIVLVIGFASSFMSNAVTHTKQEEMVDRNHLTVNTAEAGVDYYSTILNSIYLETIPELDEFIDKEITKIVEKTEESEKKIEIDIVTESKRIQDALGEKLAAILHEATKPQSFFNNNNKNSMKTIEPYEFTLNKLESDKLFIIQYDDSLSQVEVLGNILGKNTSMETNEVQELTFQQFFEIPNLENEISQALGRLVGQSIPRVIEPIDPICVVTSTYETLKNKEYINSDVCVKGNMTGKNNLNIDSGATLYVKKRLQGEGSGLSIKIDEVSKAYILENSSNIKNVEVIDESELFIGSDLKFSNNNPTFKVDGKSKVYIGGSLIDASNTKFIDGSEVSIVGDFKSSNNNPTFTINQSNFYLGGSLTNASKTEITLYSKVNILGNVTLANNNPTFTISQSEFHLEKNLSNASNTEFKDNSKISILGDLTLTNNNPNLTIQDSHFFLGGNLVNAGSIKLNKNSKVCLAGNLHFTKNLDIKKDTLFMLEGKKIYKGNNLKHAKVVSIDEVQRLSTIKELQEICGLSIKAGDSKVNWDKDKDVEVEY
ncbi:hypothetical protein [Oceanobacillus sp. CAU 1775]